MLWTFFEWTYSKFTCIIPVVFHWIHNEQEYSYIIIIQVWFGCSRWSATLTWSSTCYCIFSTPHNKQQQPVWAFHPLHYCDGEHSGIRLPDTSGLSPSFFDTREKVYHCRILTLGSKKKHSWQFMHSNEDKLIMQLCWTSVYWPTTYHWNSWVYILSEDTQFFCVPFHNPPTPWLYNTKYYTAWSL